MRLTTGILLLCVASCGGGSPAPAPPIDGSAPDFLLQDVNTTSPTFGNDVSPRDELGRVSAWYFGSAT